uniref:Uncharacterized protein n=1 Tax=Staphylococcus phage HS12 TaxID=3056402 RepID=A0AA50AEU0_9VIRU|nr:MAG: hypothetical protein [Staphylococcus phage HS12]
MHKKRPHLLRYGLNDLYSFKTQIIKLKLS